MKTWQFISILVGFLILIGLYLGIADFSPKEDSIMQKIVELERKIDSLNNQKDSIRTVIDSTHIKILTNEKYYQERINTIIHQSASTDSGFIANYIRLYSEQNPLFDTK